MITSLSKIPIFSDIPEKELSKILPLLKERSFKKNHLLMFENDESDEVYIIRSGLLKVFRLHEDKEIVLSIAMPGEILGEVEALSLVDYRISSIEALEDVSAWQIRRKDFLQLVETYPVILKNAYKILVERTRILNRLIRYLSFYDVRTKVANLIVDFYFNFGELTDAGYRIDLKINQSFLATMLGTSRESVSKTLNEFQDEKLIDIREKNFYILDMKKLESICNQTEEIQSLRKWYNL
ncbi:Crp/Fnr family transcriptional regulator [Planococcus shixiaomingii]|uniref:Crp/Fnr family transcriptional regulator n=1 Tax=Planococcus shixiaomingii TaxID=3058393 RepID=UPI0026031B50|nr:Crp/Fnr family transcriptional regulator [Planococcus sp. N022]WKA56490.1 Crp/Fnr family transcriptional regulator [Planococcus sp. N022]